MAVVSERRPKILIAAVFALVGAFLAAAAAFAGPGPVGLSFAQGAQVERGASEFQITSNLVKRMNRFNISLDGINAARVRGNPPRWGMNIRKGNLKVKTNQPGPYDPVKVTGVSGWVNVTGRFRFQNNRIVYRNGRRVRQSQRSVIMNLQINLDQGTLRGRFGRNNSNWRLMTFPRNKLRFGGTPTAPEVSNIRLSFRPKTRQRLNRRTSTRFLKNNPPMFGIASFQARLR